MEIWNHRRMLVPMKHRSEMAKASIKDKPAPKATLDPAISPEVQARYKEIVAKIPCLRDRDNRKLLDKAFVFSSKAHAGQTRVSGEPYVTHPLEVMGILAGLNIDLVTLLGTMLHDVVEDTGVTVEDVAHEFGPVVALLVEGMTKLKSLRYNSKRNEEHQAEYFRKMLLSMAQDLRVILIKLADRLHNMRTLDALPPKSQRRIAEETLGIYAPLAHRFGVGRIKWELEDLSLKVIDVVAYRRIAERVAMKRGEREATIDGVIKPLKKRLKEEGIKGKLFGRAKHFYSIYNKIIRRGKSFSEILDLLAVRVIVDTIPDCYRALGVVHNLFTPILERFGDYIAMPKANLYQSLHTKVLDEQGHTVEIQIRTNEMDMIAEMGIAAHWQYKEGGDEQPVKPDTLQEYSLWLRQLIEGSREEDSSEEFMKTLKINLFTDEIFVFTPRGKLIQLPKHSSPIDFAFAVHTDIGLQTLGAKIDGRMVQLDYELHSGNTVEILTSVQARPSVDWLRFVRTSRARSKIKRYLKQTQFRDSIAIGEQLLKREFARYKHKPSKQDFSDLTASFSFDNVETFFAAIGAGDLSATKVVRRLIPTEDVKETEKETPSSVSRLLHPTKKRSAHGVMVKGVDNMMITFGNCCNPMPGDRILGFISKGRGIIVHRIDCTNIADLTRNKDKLVDVEWDAHQDDRFISRLRIFSEDRPHLLRDIAEVVSKLGVNIVEVNMRAEGPLAIGSIIVNVSGLSQLSRLLNRINRVKGVVQVERMGIADEA